MDGGGSQLLMQQADLVTAHGESFEGLKRGPLLDARHLVVEFLTG